MAKGRTKVTCESCYFKQNLLCALQETQACSTFRPADPAGLAPPRQMRFVYRQERRTRSAWAFPTAEEQVALRA
jgi:hypothetical protein